MGQCFLPASREEESVVGGQGFCLGRSNASPQGCCGGPRQLLPCREVTTCPRQGQGSVTEHKVQATRSGFGLDFLFTGYASLDAFLSCLVGVGCSYPLGSPLCAPTQICSISRLKRIVGAAKEEPYGSVFSSTSSHPVIITIAHPCFLPFHGGFCC